MRDKAKDPSALHAMNWRIVSVFAVAAFGICAMLALALPLALIVGEPGEKSDVGV